LRLTKLPNLDVSKKIILISFVLEPSIQEIEKALKIRSPPFQEHTLFTSIRCFKITGSS